MEESDHGSIPEEKWKLKLTPERFHVLREKGTESPYTGKGDLLYMEKNGRYICAGCGQTLFTSESKFDAGCGWPSFDSSSEKEAILEEEDTSHGMVRTEVTCSKCKGHLGHVFNDGPSETGLRYCINSLSLYFVEE